MDIINLPRYEMGRCVSCGDCNRDPAYVDSDGEWVKFEDAKVASSNSLQQLKAEIAALALEFDLYLQGNANHDGLPILQKLRQLSAV